MRGALGPEVTFIQLLDTLQHPRAMLQRTQEHGSCADTLLQGPGQVPWNVAKRQYVFIRVLYAFLIVGLEVLCRCDSASVIALLREQHVVVDDREELDEEMVHHFLNVYVVLVAGDTSQATARGGK